MRTCLVSLFMILSLSTVAQENQLEELIIRGNWSFRFINKARLETSKHQVGDTVLLVKVPKRLKFKRNLPTRFKSDGTALTPKASSDDVLYCGNMSKLEALTNLKWKEYAQWEIGAKNGEEYLYFDRLNLRLIQSSKRENTFIVSE